MSNTSGRITLWNVEVFVATAEEASISMAAKRLETSPATVSQQITSLEGAIETSLLNRSARPVTLTPASMAERLRPVLQELIVGPATTYVPWLEGQMKVLNS